MMWLIRILIDEWDRILRHYKKIGLMEGLPETLRQDRDVSKIDVYICDYIEYMDELKVYHWSADHEEKKKEKRSKHLLDERPLS